jgi:biotin synthase
LLALPAAELPALFWGADTIRRSRRGGTGLTCAIMNAKSGACSEDCIYCAQSAPVATQAAVYPLPAAGELIAAARAAQERGADRFSFVTSGRGLDDGDVDRLCEVITRLPQEGVRIPVCLSLGILGEVAFRKLRAAGAVRYHHNLETSRRHFPAVTTTHTWQDRFDTSQGAGVQCSRSARG